jgi:hypothetical protein
MATVALGELNISAETWNGAASAASSCSTRAHRKSRCDAAPARCLLRIAHAVVAPERPDCDAMRMQFLHARLSAACGALEGRASCFRSGEGQVALMALIAISWPTTASCTAPRRHGRITQRPRNRFS